MIPKEILAAIGLGFVQKIIHVYPFDESRPVPKLIHVCSVLDQHPPAAKEYATLYTGGPKLTIAAAIGDLAAEFDTVRHFIVADVGERVPLSLVQADAYLHAAVGERLRILDSLP